MILPSCLQRINENKVASALKTIIQAASIEAHREVQLRIKGDFCRFFNRTYRSGLMKTVILLLASFTSISGCGNDSPRKPPAQLPATTAEQRIPDFDAARAFKYLTT